MLKRPERIKEKAGHTMKHWKFYLTLRRYLWGSLTEAEKQRFDQFIDETTLDDADATWSEEEQGALLERINKKIHEPMPVKKRMSTPRFVAVATLVTVALLAVYYAVLMLVIKPDTNGGMEKTLLSDGTIVWLNASDKLSYYEGGAGDNVRHASLSGEALFEVAKDSLRPFIIQCGSTSLKVVGTSFTVRTVHDSVTLSVLTGTVHIYSSDDTTGVRVQPKEKVVYAGHGPIAKRTQKPNDVPAYVRSTEYNMQFIDATVTELVARIEQKFDVSVTITDAHLNRCHVTADFTDHSLDKTLTMLAEVLDITYTVNGTAVTLTGTGCQ